MGKEIERKFLVNTLDFMSQSSPCRIVQGYLCCEAGCVVRIRQYDDRAFITVKSASVGYARDEFEYAIPVEDADKMLSDMCHGFIIEKMRYRVSYEGFVWEIDVFQGRNRGLVVAEIELPATDTPFKKPSFIGAEVTDDPRYYNANLYETPYTLWV
ncbi:MAG: CYTH domain-containing protein [Prevotellaceae bacterium]|jgi:CYTH domain-containing protein|nr:CYTH domain-containing protein [Prevotellaceae bacterium]